MISSIHVTLNRGEISTPAQLQDTVSKLYPPQSSQAQPTSVLNTQAQLATVYTACIYSCSPASGALASFFWIDTKDFEIVIETTYYGHLLRSTEAIIRIVQRHLKQLDIDASIEISLMAPSDARTYILGRPQSTMEELWKGLKDNIVAIVIGVILILVSAVFLPNYFQEAIAGIITLVLFSIWQGIKIWSNIRKRPIDWRINE